MNNRIMIVTLLLLLLSVQASAAVLSVSTLSYEPAPAAPGQLITVWVTLTNSVNGTATSVSVEPRLSYPFTTNPTGKSTILFDSIGPYRSVTGRLDIQVDKGALNGTYPLEVRVTQGNETTGVSSTVSITVLTYKPQIEILSAEIPDTPPGQVVNATLKIKNIGSSRAINILLGTSDDRVVTTTGAIVDRPIKNIGSTLSYIESLDAGQTADIPMRFGVDTTAEQKTYLVPIQIKYQDENRSDFSVTRYIGMRIQAQPELDTYLTYDAKAKPYPGGTVEVTVNLFNRGTGSAKNIVVEAKENPLLDITTEKKVFIGTLDSDDFDSFKFTAHVADSVKAGEPIPLTIRFDYKNENNETKTLEIIAPLTVFDATTAKTDGQSEGISLFTIVLALILVVAAYFGYQRFFGKKNGKNK
ncbi:MAG: hypothetical protein Q7R47_05575 [Candidatus Diapherotrites archaeon]|nr:hypothetical protein [Candidatus Diapherotrites archaeon]